MLECSPITPSAVEDVLSPYHIRSFFGMQEASYQTSIRSGYLPAPKTESTEPGAQLKHRLFDIISYTVSRFVVTAGIEGTKTDALQKLEGALDCLYLGVSGIDAFHTDSFEDSDVGQRWETDFGTILQSQTQVVQLQRELNALVESFENFSSCVLPFRFDTRFSESLADREWLIFPVPRDHFQSVSFPTIDGDEANLGDV